MKLNIVNNLEWL